MPPATPRQLLRLATGIGVAGMGGLMLASQLAPVDSAPQSARSSWRSWINLGADKIYFHFGRPLRKLVDAEAAHEQAIRMASRGRLLRELLGLVPPQFEWPELRCAPFDRQRESQLQSGNWKAQVQLKSLHFSNPVGLAAGFDKNGAAVDGLLDMGFGFVEIGSVTPQPQPGNPRPRVFRLEEDRAIINRYGFNSQGADTVEQHLQQRMSSKERTPGLVGVNLGMNKTSVNPIADYQIGVDKLARFADYLVVNVSSPNTAGLRDLQRKESLQSLLGAIKKRRDDQFAAAHQPAPPLLVKIAPDLFEQDKQDIADACVDAGIDGLIISNTTIGRPPELRSPNQTEVGGLSGAPLKHISTELIRDMYQKTKGQLVIIGVGGVETGIDAYDKIKAGASLVQIYSSFAYGGPYQVHLIKRDLVQLLRKDGFKNVAEAVGSDHRKTDAATPAAAHSERFNA